MLYCVVSFKRRNGTRGVECDKQMTWNLKLGLTNGGIIRMDGLIQKTELWARQTDQG